MNHGYRVNAPDAADFGDNQFCRFAPNRFKIVKRGYRVNAPHAADCGAWTAAVLVEGCGESSCAPNCVTQEPQGLQPRFKMLSGLERSYINMKKIPCRCLDRGLVRSELTLFQ
jgi:hypothetical protein